MKITKTEITADVVVENEAQEILLIKRSNEPFKGKWALPGGFVETDEEVATAAARELKEETGLDFRAEALHFIDYFDAPDRDPRGRVVSFAFGVKLVKDQAVQGNDDASEASWFPWTELPELGFDHQSIVARWKER